MHNDISGAEGRETWWDPAGHTPSAPIRSDPLSKGKKILAAMSASLTLGLLQDRP